MHALSNLLGSFWAAINEHKHFLLWFSIVFFYLCQVFKIACVIRQTNCTSASKFVLLIGIISVKCLQFTKYENQIKCYKKCFIELEFYEFVRKKSDECPSARMFKFKQ